MGKRQWRKDHDPLEGVLRHVRRVERRGLFNWRIEKEVYPVDGMGEPYTEILYPTGTIVRVYKDGRVVTLPKEE